MKCQQYLVRAKDVRTAIWSCILAAITLITLALLAVATAIAARQAGIIPSNLDGKQVIPYILAWVSGGTEHFLGIVAIARCGSVTRYSDTAPFGCKVPSGRWRNAPFKKRSLLWQFPHSVWVVIFYEYRREPFSI